MPFSEEAVLLEVESLLTNPRSEISHKSAGTSK